MFFSKTSFLALFIASIGVTFVFQNCSNVNLSQIDYPVITQANNKFCLKPPSEKKRFNNVLFAIDRSGSNGPHDGDPGNDPTKMIRGLAIEDFYNRHKDDPFYRWGFIFYSGQKISSYINQGDGRIPTFENSDTMQSAIGQFYSDSDVSGTFGTDYSAALDLVETAIENDIILNQVKTEEEHVYTIFFASDGRPIENSQDRPITGPSDPRIKKIEQLVSLPARHISLSTVYYARPDYPGDPSAAIQGLRLMAEVGNGQFADIRDTGTINFGDVVVGERPEAWRIKRMRLVVFNLNSAACESGEIEVDSDSDGICDEDELAYNNRPYYKTNLAGKKFDPQNRNSIDPNYNDSFYWKFSLLPTGAGLTDCPDHFKGDEDFDFLNQCEEGMIHDNAANGPHQGWIIPNASANPLNPDSDGDAFMDWIEFSWFRLDSAFSAPVNYTNIFDQYAPNVSAETLMAEHRHIIRPDDFTSSSYDTKLRFVGLNEIGENCYSYTQSQLELFNTLPVTNSDNVGGYSELTHAAGENKILMYFIATPEQSPNATGALYHTVRTINFNAPPLGHNGDLGIEPDLSDFKKYRIPEVFEQTAN